MRYPALCTDYDGTLATHGRLLPDTESALERLRASGRRLVMVGNSGQSLRLLEAPIPIDCPVRLLHGLDDADVPWRISMRVMDRLRSGDVRLTLIKNGDHRLSRPDDVAGLIAAVDALCESLK